MDTVYPIVKIVNILAEGSVCRCYDKIPKHCIKSLVKITKTPMERQGPLDVQITTFTILHVTEEFMMNV